MPKTTLAGHPLHPQLVTAPLGLLPFSFAMDLMHLATGRRTYAEAAKHAMKAGVASALAAGAAGAMDYLEIERGSHSKRIANVHAGLNTAITGLYAVNLGLRERRRVPSGRVPTLLSLVGTAALFTSAWYGGHLVYEHGMRVRGRSEVAGAPAARPPYDEAVHDTFAGVPDAAPAGGPQASRS